MSSFNFNYKKIESITDLKGISMNKESFWQSPLWAEILIKTQQADVFVVQNDKNSILIERRSIWKGYSGLYILGVIPSLITGDFLTGIQEKIVSEKDLFLQIEPLGDDTGNSFSFELFQSHAAPFRRFIEPVTALLNLTTPKEELLASFAEKGRYNIRLAQKRGVTARWVRGLDKYNDTTYFDAFYRLLDETTKRDGFAHNSLTYYKHFVETLESQNAGGLLIAEKEGTLHAAGIFAYFGDMAIYYYGASSSDTAIRRDMATYLLQWNAMEEGIRRGCTTYDFLGISADGKGKLAGVTEFKLRFNPEKKHWMSERVMIFKPFTLKVLQFISRIRKIFR